MFFVCVCSLVVQFLRYLCIFCSFSTLILLVGSFDLGKTVSQISCTVLVKTLNHAQSSVMLRHMRNCHAHYCYYYFVMYWLIDWCVQACVEDVFVQRASCLGCRPRSTVSDDRRRYRAEGGYSIAAHRLGNSDKLHLIIVICRQWTDRLTGSTSPWCWLMCGDVTDSASEFDGIRHFSEIRNPTYTWNPIASDAKLLTAD